MTEREKLDEIWDSVYYTEDMKENLNHIAPKLVELLVRSLIEEEQIEIGKSSAMNHHGSSVAYDSFNSDKMLWLICNQHSKFILFLGLENSDSGDMERLFHELAETEISIVPEGLRNLMKRARDTDEVLVYQHKSLE